MNGSPNTAIQDRGSRWWAEWRNQDCPDDYLTKTCPRELLLEFKQKGTERLDNFIHVWDALDGDERQGGVVAILNMLNDRHEPPDVTQLLPRVSSQGMADAFGEGWAGMLLYNIVAAAEMSRGHSNYGPPLAIPNTISEKSWDLLEGDIKVLYACLWRVYPNALANYGGVNESLIKAYRAGKIKLGARLSLVF